MSSELRRARNRQMVIFLLVCAAIVFLLGRLYYWQILQSNSGYRLAQQASDEHISSEIVNAPRGLIFDAEGHLLATNVVRDDVYIEPIQFATDHPDNYQADVVLQAHKLHEVLSNVSEDQLVKDFYANLAAVRVAGPIEPAQSAQLRKLQLPDIFLEPRTWRHYPAGDLAAQVLGYVREADDGHGTQGVYGIEYKYNKLLAGKPGSFTAETDLSGNPLTVGSSSGQSPVNGADLTLTIDSDIQYKVQSGLVDTVKQAGAQSGTAVVINVHTGAIVAMAGAPTFDPNQYGDYAGQKGCIGSEEVYITPALYCSYEPGSTMKAITMAAALDQKLITPDTTINDPGYLDFSDGTPRVTNWRDKGYGQETMTQVLQHSANVGAAYVAYHYLKPQGLYPYLERFGFGKPTGVLEPEDAGGYRTDTSSGWTMSDLTRQSFGQSITVTPLQLAMAYQAIANGGVMMQPYIVASVNDNGHVQTTQPHVQRRVISADTAKTLAGMLSQVATFNAITIPGYSTAIKTGTATTQGLEDDQTEASVAGFVPASQPQFVILVKLDRPTHNIYGRSEERRVG